MAACRRFEFTFLDHSMDELYIIHTMVALLETERKDKFDFDVTGMVGSDTANVELPKHKNCL